MQRPNSIIAGIEDIAFPILANDIGAVAVIYCPFVSQSDAQAGDIEGTIRTMSNLAEELAAVIPTIDAV